MKLRALLFTLVIIFTANLTFAQQDDDFDDFDFSQFEEAGSSLKSFCTNKVLGQSPTQLISLSFDMQGASTLGVPSIDGLSAEDVDFDYSPGFRFNSNIPIISKNNVLVNWSLNYTQLGYVGANDPQRQLGIVLDGNSLKWLNTSVVLFKPLNEKRFLLFQLGAELNGDYDFDNLPSTSNLRVPAAAIYGFKPNDNLIWGVGVSRTYLGGALNYLPIVYYYQTFKNEKWGLEALVPARIQLRYRSNSRNVFLLGYTVEGASYRLSNFNYNYPTIAPFPNVPADQRYDKLDEIELRRSEIRGGLTYQHGLNDFIWIGASAGYRVNYSFELDRGDFYRGFSADDYFMENDLSNTWFLQVSLSLVSP